MGKLQFSDITVRTRQILTYTLNWHDRDYFRKHMQNKYNHPDLPKPVKQGLYDPSFEHDACGVGMVANIKGIKSHEIVDQGLEALCNLGHRGATGADPETGDGAGIPGSDRPAALPAAVPEGHL